MAANIEGLVVCWDFGGTLYSVSSGKKPGIDDFLEQLVAHGNLNFVTSRGPRADLKNSLEKLRFNPRVFLEVLGSEDICLQGEDGGKYYQPIASRLGLTAEEAIQRIIIIGDGGDSGQDISPTYIQHDNCAAYDASLTGEILHALTLNQPNNIAAGFDRLYQQSPLRALSQVVRQVTLSEGEILFGMVKRELGNQQTARKVQDIMAANFYAA